MARAKVPLTRVIGVIAIVTQELGDGHGVARQIAFITRLAFRGWIEGVIEGAEAYFDTVRTGKHLCASNRGHWRGVKVVKANALFCKIAQGWSVDF